MAVKVMVASAIARGDLARPAAAKAVVPARDPARPKRRRSSVFDAEGNEVFITLMCLKCHKMRPLSQFGLRRMADGAIRNQPWCRTCRSAPAAAPEEKRRRKGPSHAEESPVSGESPARAAPSEAAPEPRRPGSMAAEVAAALAAGRG